MFAWYRWTLDNFYFILSGTTGNILYAINYAFIKQDRCLTKAVFVRIEVKVSKRRSQDDRPIIIEITNEQCLLLTI